MRPQRSFPDGRRGATDYLLGRRKKKTRRRETTTQVKIRKPEPRRTNGPREKEKGKKKKKGGELRRKNTVEKLPSLIPPEFIPAAGKENDIRGALTTIAAGST